MRTIYFDNSATTAPCAEALEKTREILEGCYGNPSSVHFMGLAAEEQVRSARASVMSSLGAGTSGRIIFTASGSEANNLAVLGCARAKKYHLKPRIIVSDSEHPSIMKQVEALEASGWDAVRIPTRGGQLDLDMVKEAAVPGTVIASFMLVNNETGALYDVRRAFSAVKAACPDAACHCDAVQGFLKVPFSPASLGCDMITLSAHKIGGLKGCGALWFSAETAKRRRLSPVIYGGGQEEGLRSGTENVLGIAAFGAACASSASRYAGFAENCREIREYIIKTLAENGNGMFSFNLPQKAAPHILSITNRKIRGETLVRFLSSKGICISAGSACSAGKGERNYVLAAFGLDDDAALKTVRVSLGPGNTLDEARVFCDELISAVNSLSG